MKDNSFLNERIQPIAEACRPLKVNISLRCVKDKYYIHFDGSGTYPHSSSWDDYWMGFEKYVIHLLSSGGFSATEVKMKTDTYAIAFVGTLFDFLKQKINE